MSTALEQFYIDLDETTQLVYFEWLFQQKVGTYV